VLSLKFGEVYVGPSEGAEKVASWRKDVPQRLKPHCEQGSCGTGEPVPLSKTDFFSTLSALIRFAPVYLGLPPPQGAKSAPWDPGPAQAGMWRAFGPLDSL